MFELKINSLKSFLATLKYFASEQEQIRYKNAVPFVHIPIEILEQMSSQERMINESSWYFELFSDDESKKIKDFYRYCDEETEVYKDDFPDVPEIFLDPKWQLIISKADYLYKEFEPIVEQKIRRLGSVKR